jgi:hypothetical protein
VFYYASSESAKVGRYSGIAARSDVNGVPVTLRCPHEATANDFKVFNPQSSEPSSPHLDDEPPADKESLFPCEEVLVLSLPRKFLQPLPGYETDDGLFMVSIRVLNALRATVYTDVQDSGPWIQGECILPPQCILRSFKISKASKFRKRSSSSFDFIIKSRSNSSNSHIDNDKIEDEMMPGTHVVTTVTSIKMLTKSMRQIRFDAKEVGLIPLYHYTSPSVAPLILNSGLRMSTQGQGDGGVYVTTQGPASYGIGTPNYETNIIKDCFGMERLEEYLGKGYLDVIIVYGCDPDMLEQVYKVFLHKWCCVV